MSESLRSAAYTLFDGNYHLGAAALINSLFFQGFRGDFYVGYRGAPPPWAPEGGRGVIDLESRIRVKFVELTTDWHLAHYKATLGLRVLELDPTIQRLFYFDPDIVVTKSWKYYDFWVSQGIAAVADPVVFPPTAPRWLALRAWAANYGIRQARPVEYHLNSGFFGLQREHAAMLQAWHDMEVHFMRDVPSGRSLSPFMEDFPFSQYPDQELFCFAIATGDWPCSYAGLMEMGFQWAGAGMQHAIGAPKPWNKSLWRILREKKPCDLEYLHYSTAPIQAGSRWRRKVAKWLT